MNERTATVGLMEALKRLPQVPTRIIKHSDRATSGVPDFTCSWNGDTYWIEDKHWPTTKTLKAVLKKNMDQMIMCHDLWNTTRGKCWVVVYRDSPKEIQIWVPRVLVSEIWPTIVIPTGLVKPATITESCPNVWNVLRAVGMVRADGWQHSLVTRLIMDYNATCRAGGIEID